ncbi:NHLP bacteriocin export ABC transporter permease/ATPase subunit [Thiorhodococcus fuscus]|uniref:NHLP bacteriocin export ABC transporter permease/ATPase subunit n=1 Tax=Thiorhodococcus fuscus TaxID=527200 RepID=A0ABW4Y7S4_9GAMM
MTDSDRPDSPTGTDSGGEPLGLPSSVPANLAPLLAALDLATDTAPWLGARDSFNLVGAERVWMLLAGTLDLFICDPAPDGGAGRRRFILSLPPGGLCIGFRDEPGMPPVIAVPRKDTRLVATDLTALMALGGKPDLTAPLAAALDAWISRLTAADSRARPPATCRVQQDSEAIEVGEGDSIQADGERVFWLQETSAQVLIRGETEMRPTPDAALPVTADNWIRATVADTWTLTETLDWLKDQPEVGLLASLQAFQARTMTRLRSVSAVQATASARRALAANVGSRAELSQGIGALAAVFQRGRRLGRGRASDPLIASLQIAADAIGLELPAEAELEPALASQDPLLMMARRAGFSVRGVDLNGRWWDDDHGPLIGTLKEDGQPIVLLPGRHGRYECLDPVSARVQPVDASLAEGIDRQARMLYRPLPEGVLRPAELLGFGFRGSLREGLIAFALLLAIGLLSLVTPILTGWILDPIIPQAELGQLLTLVVAILIAGLAQQIFSLVQSLILLRIEGRVANSVQCAVWDRLLRLPAAFFNQFSAGDLANRAMSIDALRQALSSSAITALTHGVVGVFSLGMMIYYDWRLSLAASIVVAIYAFIVIYAGRRVLRLNRVQLRLGGQLQGLVLQLLGAVDKLRTTGSERHAFGRWADLYGQQQANSFDQQVLNNRLVVFKTVFQNFATFAIILVIAWQGGELLAFYRSPETWSEIDSLKLQTLMPTGVFVAFYAAFGQFLGAAFGLSEQAIQLANIPAYYERVAPILSAAPESMDGVDPGQIQGEITVHEVQFRYAPDTPLVLRGVSLEAKAGEFIAIAGPSGAGKSSLVRLLLGFDAPEAGSIYLDGQDVAALDKRGMRQNFGVVLQNGRLLAGTLLQNIVAGAQLTRDDAMAAARLAGLDKDIEAMPMGLDTYLSEGASTLSGGQRQRLMIARAIVRRPRVLIFDEATSALDNMTQAVVTQSLERLNSTRIVIAHRLSTIIRADRIYVIDKGRVVESGTYEELMARDALFAAMARRQVL